ncbi:nose resistant to fluoxetine protein 6-like [Centruroides vittatus]|uniref:nose resistant to fluoxetine protein 6-like n=1 Tax=Centruroides vittatus TaxID=120091 RepID=UPI0035101C10
MKIEGILILVFLLLFLINISESNEGNSTVIKDKSYETFKHAELFTRQLIEKALKYVLPMAMRLNSEIKINKKCSTSLMKVFFGLRRLKNWALKMMDAMGKPPSGILDGTMTTFGAYDECLRIKALEDRPDKSKILFKGQYCVIEGRPKMPPKPHERQLTRQLIDVKNVNSSNLFNSMLKYSFVFHFMKLRYGICIPSTCSKLDLQNIIHGVLRIYKLNFDVSVPRCETEVNFDLSILQIVILCCISAIVMLIICGTLLDLIHHSNNSKIRILAHIRFVFCSFSLRLNGSKLISTKTATENLKVLHGIRVLTLSWLILGSSFAFFNPQHYKGLRLIRDTVKDVSFQTVLNAWISIDSFFFMSGLLLMYITYKGVEEKNGKICITYFLFSRFIRLIPVLLAVICSLLLLPIVGSGPVWEEFVGSRVEKCQENWWATLLFINNWISYDNMCLQVSWYTSVDVQLHILSLIILIPFFKKRKIGIAIGVFLIIACSLTIVIYMVLTDMFPSTILPDKDLQHRIADLYMKPYTHAGPFCIGLFTGYFIVRYSETKIKKSIQVVMWCGALMCNLLVIYLPHRIYSGYVSSPFGTAQFTAITRLCWATGLSWICYACITGKAGFANKIFSFKLFIPLSRLTYCAFLLHEIVLALRYGLLRQTLVFSNYNMVYEFLSTFFVVMVLSVFLHLGVEAPLTRIKYYIFPDWYYFTRNKCTIKRHQTEEVQLDQLAAAKDEA